MLHLQFSTSQAWLFRVHGLSIVQLPDQPSFIRLLLQPAIISSLLVKEHAAASLPRPDFCFQTQICLVLAHIHRVCDSSHAAYWCVTQHAYVSRSKVICHAAKLMQDMQAKSAGLQTQLDTEQDINRELRKRMDTLEADLNDETKRAVSAEDEVDCLEAELADAVAKADSSLLKFKVGSQSCCCLPACTDRVLGM